MFVTILLTYKVVYCGHACKANITGVTLLMHVHVGSIIVKT